MKDGSVLFFLDVYSLEKHLIDYSCLKLLHKCIQARDVFIGLHLCLLLFFINKLLALRKTATIVLKLKHIWMLWI